MLDRWTNIFLNRKMQYISAFVPRNISANTITIFGFIIGLIAVVLISKKLYSMALVMIFLNRFFDGLDGAVARRNGITDFGGYLDITCDFIFYSAVIFGFALAEPEKNSIWAIFLIFSFVGTGTSFLAFAAIAKNHPLFLEVNGQKSLYFKDGLVEGTETVLFYILACMFPGYFPIFALIFGVLCWLTVFGRIRSAFSSLS